MEFDKLRRSSYKFDKHEILRPFEKGVKCSHRDHAHSYHRGTGGLTGRVLRSGDVNSKIMELYCSAFKKKPHHIATTIQITQYEPNREHAALTSSPLIFFQTTHPTARPLRRTPSQYDFSEVS